MSADRRKTWLLKDNFVGMIRGLWRGINTLLAAAPLVGEPDSGLDSWCRGHEPTCTKFVFLTATVETKTVIPSP